MLKKIFLEIIFFEEDIPKESRSADSGAKEDSYRKINPGKDGHGEDSPRESGLGEDDLRESSSGEGGIREIAPEKDSSEADISGKRDPKIEKLFLKMIVLLEKAFLEKTLLEKVVLKKTISEMVVLEKILFKQTKTNGLF